MRGEEGHGKIEYCFQCGNFPCEKYEMSEEYDSFIIHRNRFKDFKKMKAVGTKAYQNEQIEKTAMLKDLLENYNDGRKKMFFCLAVSLLELDDLQAVMEKVKIAEQEKDVSVKEKALYLTELFQKTASQKSVILKLRRKPAKSKEKQE